MTSPELLALLPLIAAAALPVALILAIAVRRAEPVALWLTVGGFALVLAALVPTAGAAPMAVTPLLRVDGLARFFIALAALAGAATVLLARADPGRDDYGHEEREELYVLVALAVLGAAVLGMSRHFAALFLGLEILSLSLFPLIAYRRRDQEGLEAGIKYLVLASVASGLLLFGIALLYAGLGSLELQAVGAALGSPTALADPLTAGWVLGGLALVLAGLALKLSLIPLHWWTPDVYQGAPAAVTGFLASVSKGAAAVALLRVLAESGSPVGTGLVGAASVGGAQSAVLAVVAALAILSMLGGNLLALMQESLRRILAYSSIAHMGYLLVAFLAAGAFAREAVGIYLAAYFVTTLGAFGVLTLLGPRLDSLHDLRGLYRVRPALAACLTLMLLSLAGIPLTAGFVGKFYLFAAGVDGALWVPVLVLAAASAIGLFYYLRVVFALYSPSLAPAPPRPAGAWTGPAALAALTLALLGLGTWPRPAIEAVQTAVAAAPAATPSGVPVSPPAAPPPARPEPLDEPKQDRIAGPFAEGDQD